MFKAWRIFALVCLGHYARVEGAVTYLLSPVLDASEHLPMAAPDGYTSYLVTKETGQNIKKMHEDYITNGQLIPSSQLFPISGFSISVNEKGQPRMGLK